MQVRVADQAAGVFDAEHIAVAARDQAQRQREATVTGKRDCVAVNRNDVTRICLAAQAIRILGSGWFWPWCCTAWIAIFEWLILRFDRRVKMQPRQLDCRFDALTDIVDHLQIDAVVARCIQGLRELTPVIHIQRHAIHGDEQFVRAGLVHSRALDRGQLTDNFHPAIQLAPGFGHVARDWTIFTESLDDEAVRQQLEFVDEIIECCIGSGFGE